MDAVRIKPEKELKTLWYISWAVSIAVVILSTVGFMFLAETWLMVALIFFWFLISIPVIIWIPAAFRVLEYGVDDEGVKMKGGVIWKKQVTVPYSKITNVDITQGPMQRYFNIGTVHVQTAGAGGQQGQKAELKMNGIRELEVVRDIIVKEVRSLTYTPVGDITKKETPTTPDSASVFENILTELREIKNLLVKRKDE
jgi:uncharacterized protein